LRLAWVRIGLVAHIVRGGVEGRDNTTQENAMTRAIKKTSWFPVRPGESEKSL
jgi:hypothetical protein